MAHVRTRRWLPPGRAARRSRGLFLGGTWLRISTRLRRSVLDAELARGVDPIESDELSLRAGQLGSVRTRARLACALEGVVEISDRPVNPFSPTSIRRPEVRACRSVLIDLAERLRDAGPPPHVQGVAMIALLISDGSSPLYRAETDRPLIGTAHLALIALERPGMFEDAADDCSPRRRYPWA